MCELAISPAFAQASAQFDAVNPRPKFYCTKHDRDSNKSRPSVVSVQNEMEKPSDLVSSITKAISQFTKSDVAKTTHDLSEVTKDQIEQIAHPVELHFDCDDLERVSQVKRSRVSAPSDDDDDDDDDILCGSNDHWDLLEENVIPDHVEPSGFQRDYSSLTEDASNIGDESLNQEEYAESWLHQHAMKLDDLYYDELQKISENMECPSGMSEAESDDLQLPENLESLEEMLCDRHNRKDNTNQRDQSLYEGCPITVGISMLLIMTVAMRHGMTGEALQDILTLISLHCISPNYCTESLRRFKQYFSTAKSPLVFHHYCSHCFLYLDDKGADTCPNTLCQKPLKGLGKKAFFIEIPIVSQLQDLYKQVFIWKTVTSYRFNRERTNDDLGDIYDGALYRQHWDSGFLKDHRNISFIYNTDGVPIFKSSKYSLSTVSRNQ